MRIANILSAAACIAVLGALPLALAGCGDGLTSTGGGAGSTNTGPTVEEACASLATALCGQIDKCAPFLMDISYGDKTTCEKRVAPNCLVTPESAGTTLDAAGIQACADAYGTATCDQVYAGLPEQCRPPGEKADGEPCAHALQCKGLVCQTEAEGECGTCATFLEEGAACDPAEGLCGPELFCEPVSGKCEAFAKSGEPCTMQKACISGLSCNEGKCGPLQPAGGICANGESCDTAVGAICDPTKGQCVTVAVHQIGETCGYNMATGEIAVCVADAKCTGDGMCAGRPKEGEACTVDASTGEGDCVTGYNCIKGKCSAEFPVCE